MSQRTIYFCDKCCGEIAEGQKIYSVDISQYTVNKNGSVQLRLTGRMELCSDCAKSAASTDCLRDDKDAEEA